MVKGEFKTAVNQVWFTVTFLDRLLLSLTPVVLLQEHIVFLITSILTAALQFVMRHLLSQSFTVEMCPLHFLLHVLHRSKAATCVHCYTLLGNLFMNTGKLKHMP